MRILVVTNLYPPHHVGGYELGCRDIVEALRGRGHSVHVLTSSFRHAGVASPPGEAAVERVLQFNRDSFAAPHGKRGECRKLAKTMGEVAPDLVYFWNQAGLCFWLPFAARRAGYRTVFFLSDPNFTCWRIAAWLAGAARGSTLVRAVLGRSFLVRGKAAIENQPCHFASAFLRDLATRNQIPFAEAGSAVIRWGIETALFSAAFRERESLRRLLYVGQMIPQKGIHTAIAALGLLAREPQFSEFTLTLAGGGLNPEYERKVQAMPAELGIVGRVKFLGKVPRAELPGIYAQHDVLIFPSEWEEPFAITPLEAMAAGLVVVGTTTGGSGELFRNRETAMTFKAGDAADCARAIRDLCANPALAAAVRRRAAQIVTTEHTLDFMVDCIESNLQSVIARGRSPSPVISASEHHASQ